MFGAIIPEAIRQLFKKAATNLYPAEKFPTPADFRGKLVADAVKCIGCKMCERDCPAEAIKTTKVADKKFDIVIYLDRCVNCGQCVDICPTKVLSMLPDHELAEYDRKSLKTDYTFKSA